MLRSLLIDRSLLAHTHPLQPRPSFDTVSCPPHPHQTINNVKHVRNEILRLNGFDPYQHEKKEAAKILEALLSEAETEHKYERQEQKHEVPALCRWYYVHEKGVEKSKGSSSKDIWKMQANPNKRAIKEFESTASIEEQKERNPQYLEYRSEVKSLKQAMTIMQKKYTQAKDLNAKLSKLNDKDKENMAIRDQLAKALAIFDSYLDSLRLFFVESEEVREKMDCTAPLAAAKAKFAESKTQLDNFGSVVDKAKLYEGRIPMSW